MDEKYTAKMAELMKESEKDIKINFLRLEEDLPHNQNLIGKWMTYQQVYQTKYQFLELDHRIVVSEKTKYYTGKLSDDEILDRGWELEGTKILKADLHVWADSDLDIVKSKKSLIMLKQLIQLIDKTLDILIDQKKWTIKNYIDYKKFIEGN